MRTSYLTKIIALDPESLNSLEGLLLEGLFVKSQVPPR
jgi:hypothetical protein